MSMLMANPGVANLIGAQGNSSDLKTEVEILESPSVLKPVFDYVKNEKSKSGVDVVIGVIVNGLKYIYCT